MILKNLNASMLRILENCNHTYIICVLIDLLRKYQNYTSMGRLPNLVLKCILKLSKIIEKMIDSLEIDKIFLSMHEYLISVNHDNKSPNDDQGIKMIKTVINELVKLKRESIWDSYQVIECHGHPDQCISKWIQIILRSLSSNQFATSAFTITPSDARTPMNQGVEEVRMIIEDLKVPEKF